MIIDSELESQTVYLETEHDTHTRFEPGPGGRGPGQSR